MPDIDFDLVGARKAGAKPSELSSYFKSKFNLDFDFDGAYKSGASDNDVLSFLNQSYADLKKKGVSGTESGPIPSKLPSKSVLEQGAEFAQKGFTIPQAKVERPTEITVEKPKTEPVEKQGWLLNTVSALDKGFAKNFISSPIKGLGTILQGTTKKVMGGSGEGFVSDALIKYGDYLNKAIDEVTPQDEEFKGTLSDQVAQAFGQIGSLVLTGGLTGAAGKGAALVAQAPKGAAITAAKTLGSQLATPTAVSAGLSMGQSEFDRAKDAGATDDQAFEAFYKNAAVGSVLETIPVMQFFKRFNNSTGGSVANYIKTKGVAGLTGGIEEMTTEVMQQLYANKTAKDIYNINQSIMDGVGTSGGIGFGVGFLLNAMGANAKILRKQGREQEATVLENQVKQYEDNIENPKVTSGNKVSAKDIVTQGTEIGTQKAVENLDRDLANNVITPEQYQEGIDFAAKAAQVADKIPENVFGESRVKSVELLVERNDIKQANQDLLQQKQVTDEAYHAGIDEEIKANEEKIKEIDANIYDIAKKPSKDFGDKKYIVDGEEVSQEAFEALQGKPLGTKEIIKAEKPTEAQMQDDINNKRFATFTYGSESEVPEVFKDKISSSGEDNGKKFVRVTVPQSLADFELAKMEPTVSEIKEEVKPTEVKEIGADIINNTESKILLPVDELNRLRTQRETDLATGNAIDLEKNLLKNGIKEPLVITYYPEEGKARLTDGHNRLDVAKDMGAENLPIRIVYDYGEAPSSAKDFILPTKEVKPTEVKEEPKKTYQEVLKEKQEAEKKLNRQIGAEKAVVTKELYRKVKEMPAPAGSGEIGAVEVALRYLADGGKVSEEAVNDAYGSVKGAELNVPRRKKISEEVKLKDFVGGNETLNDLAHRLWEVNKQRISERDIKDKLIAEIGNNNTRIEAAEAYLEQYSPEYMAEKQAMRIAEQYEAEFLEEQEKLEKQLREPLDEQIEGEDSEDHINNLIKQYEAEIKAEDQQLRPKGEGEIDKEVGGRSGAKEITKETLVQDYKDLTRIEKRKIINSKFDELLKELKIEKICP